MLSSCEFNEIIYIISTAEAAWLYVMCFGVIFNDPRPSPINNLIVPASVLVHAVIYD